ncbi:CsiV family protein [Marinobacter sp. SS21]|uniref:CsiV family protein n=1 Tax=Marinobacter sp. SS21 TaxID=2979460 RepID=UPI002330C615|nr:CsiV family protein [Marinobacter sp. SS21]MDC0662108.1 CsiV family protein [Marinobacter sp. SS21]
MRLIVHPLVRPLLTVAAALLLASQALAQESQQVQADNAYRAEIVLLERVVDPVQVTERMAGRAVEMTPDLPGKLLVKDYAGNAHTTLNLVAPNEMRLGSAANRLVNSGRYRVLLTAGWYQAFPPDYEGEPLQVALGDWLAEAGHREIEGTITIDRQRFLHVNVALNHWRPAPEPVAAATPSIDASAPADDSVAAMAQGGEIQGAALATPKAELLTWIRETRRMRSEEIHFLDSPTIGVLVFFRKIES